MAQQQNNRNSPHLSNHLQNGSAPPSPSMSNAQQSGGQSRQPVSYPSPTSYPSPSLSSAQYSYPPPNNQVGEPYRASPTGSNGSLSLPSMRSLDPMQQQQQHMGSSLPPPVAHMGGPYYQGQSLPPPGHQYPNVTSDPTGQNLRYALPVTDQRVMSGGRHKKEIKRRTKTGCLTCRKRRIKCDEQHPACRNCQKSKRECLGYDPIFKQQPGPAAIQPAPSSAPLQGGVPATSNPYGNQPHVLQSGYGVPASNISAYDPALSAAASSPGSSNQFDYTSAIDPALEGGAMMSAQPSADSSEPLPGMQPSSYGDLQRELQIATPYALGPGILHFGGGAGSFFSQSTCTIEDITYTTPPAKRSVNELLAMGGSMPRLDPSMGDPTQQPSVLDETKHLYFSIYAPGLENFLESKWFSVKGLAKLLSDKALLVQFAILLQQFGRTDQTRPEDIQYTSSVEARMVWALATMVRNAEVNGIASDSKTVVPPTDDAAEAANRLIVFENLLTGTVAEKNVLAALVPGADSIRAREIEFWHTLGEFVRLRDDDPAQIKELDDTLSKLRNLLDGRENRDVLYSIAVVRALGRRVSEYTESDAPLHFDESDNKSKLLVAKKFVLDEASGAGTTNVIRRLCELATRSWTHVKPNRANAAAARKPQPVAT